MRLSPKNQGDSKELPSGRGMSAHLGGSYGRGQEIGDPNGPPQGAPLFFRCIISGGAQLKADGCEMLARLPQEDCVALRTH